jgi:hypothetical protein
MLTHLQGGVSRSLRSSAICLFRGWSEAKANPAVKARYHELIQAYFERSSILRFESNAVAIG